MSDSAPPSPTLIWTGRVLTALPVLGLLASSSMKLGGGPEIVEGLGKYGYAAGTILPIGLAELLSAVLIVIPQTAVFGTILATGYLGGAVSTHVRAGEPFIAPVLFGVLLWTGIGLRDARLRALLPLRRV